VENWLWKAVWSCHKTGRLRGGDDDDDDDPEGKVPTRRSRRREKGTVKLWILK
jgi:hypothetical protein